jgi:hypothetical protein
MDTEQGRTEALQALVANPHMGLAVTQLMGHNQVRINTFKWRGDIKGSTSMVKLSDGVSVRGQDLDNTTIPALIAAEVSKKSPHSSPPRQRGLVFFLPR